jgi:hypothetical protein
VSLTSALGTLLPPAPDDVAPTEGAVPLRAAVPLVEVPLPAPAPGRTSHPSASHAPWVGKSCGRRGRTTGGSGAEDHTQHLNPEGSLGRVALGAPPAGPRANLQPQVLANNSLIDTLCLHGHGSFRADRGAGNHKICGIRGRLNTIFFADRGHSTGPSFIKTQPIRARERR